MRFVIATLPDAKFSLGRDISLIKSSALFGDESILFSPTFEGLEPLIDFSKRSLLHKLIYLALLMGDPGFTKGEILTEKQREQKIQSAKSRQNDLFSMAVKVSHILHDPCDDSSAKKEIQKITQDIYHYCNAVERIWADDTDFVKRAREIIAANKHGIVNIAKIHEKPHIYYSEKKLYTDVETELTRPGSYGAVDERFFSDSNSSIQGKNNLIFSSVAAAIFDNLPNFSAATIDEIIDIKKDLAPYLSRFRKAIFDISLKIKSSPWDSDFLHDVDKELHLQLYPALSEIHEQIENNSYLREILYRLAKNPLMAPSASALGLLMSNATQTPMIIGQIASMAAGAGLIAFEAHKEYKTALKKAETNNFFFYYKAASLLRKNHKTAQQP